MRDGKCDRSDRGKREGAKKQVGFEGQTIIFSASDFFGGRSSFIQNKPVSWPFLFRRSPTER